MDFSHYNKEGESGMVDITGKKTTLRKAVACGNILMSKTTIDLIEQRLIPKGNVFEVARIAGIMAAKNTYSMIPMCHPLMLTYIDVKININREESSIYIESEIILEGKTGAEMEALTAVAVAGLTVYDMCKAVDKSMIIKEIKLLEKSGGKSDIFFEKK